MFKQSPANGISMLFKYSLIKTYSKLGGGAYENQGPRHRLLASSTTGTISDTCPQQTQTLFSLGEFGKPKSCTENVQKTLAPEKKEKRM